MSTRSDDVLFDGIYAGGRILNRSPRMPAFGESLSVDEIRSLVRYMRSLCGCRQPAWAREVGG
jgi:mono/diheme cytochrome c family protein